VILCYHKVDAAALSHWWVSADAFDRQMADLQGYDVVTLDDYDPADPDHAVVTFDGVYADVATFAGPILAKWGYPFELFVIGDWIGRDNAFDQHVEPPALFANLDELERLVGYGGRVQWHTRSHGKLAGLGGDELAAELTPAEALRERFGSDHLRWFAYPHGEHDDAVRSAVEERFDGAVSVVQGAAGDRYALPRFEVDETRNLSRSTVAVIVANYNYGRFLPEAVDSVLRQTGRVDELLVIDDASTDGSQEIMARYADRARLECNDRNLGIVDNFRKAVELTASDYVVILGADNHMRGDFVERTKAALDAHPEAAVAYTDMAIFGPRSHQLAESVGADPTAAEDVFVWRFPDPDPETLAAIGERNFIHGSSMYRRADYLAAGGYAHVEGPEDHDLFTRMLATTRTAVRVAHPVLAYRQHSDEQANTRLALQLELMHEARRRAELELARASSSLHAVHEELDRLREHVECSAADIAWLRSRSETLTAIENGGWWRLRTRLQPLLALGARVRRRLARRAR
jgi:peptidoglycan/xylan/chitin deacetylase (PgdA/CDA1 family)